MYGGKASILIYYIYYKYKVMKLNIVNLIPRAQSLKNGTTYPALPHT